MPYRYPPEFHRKVLGLITVGRSAASIAADLGVSSQTVAVRRKPELIDTGSTQGLTTDEAAELVGVGLEHRDDSPRCRCAHAVGFRNGTGNRAALMSLSTVIVAVNAQLLRRLKSDVDRS